MNTLALIFIWFALNALASILASSRQPGRKSRPELILFILAQGILAYLMIRLLIFLF